MSDPRVCRHGQLARSCERCDFDAVLAERDEAVAALRAAQPLLDQLICYASDTSYEPNRVAALVSAVLRKLDGGAA